MVKAAEHLGENLRQLRERRGLTQQQCATTAGIPRATWANLESGGANPTLTVLVKAAAALQVSVEELIRPARATCRHYPAASLPVKTRGEVVVRQLLPDPLVGLEIERLEIPAGATMRGTPHTAGTREYLTAERGCVELVAAGERWRLQPGDVVVFPGDQRHSYHNPGSRGAVAYSVISLAANI